MKKMTTTKTTTVGATLFITDKTNKKIAPASAGAVFICEGSIFLLLFGGELVEQNGR